jgi:hypothetical protein
MLHPKGSGIIPTPWQAEQISSPSPLHLGHFIKQPPIFDKQIILKVAEIINTMLYTFVYIFLSAISPDPPHRVHFTLPVPMQEVQSVVVGILKSKNMVESTLDPVPPHEEQLFLPSPLQLGHFI